MTKRKTKAEIRDEARAAWLAENADDLTPRLGERTVNQLADQHAQALADRARPTLSQRAEQRKRDELEARARERYEAWRERAAAGEPPEPPIGTGRAVPPRNVVQDGDTFTPLAFIDDKQHKLGSVPSEATARRIADVARHALATVFGKPQDNPVFPGEFAASACTVANYALGFGRGRGRPNKSAGKAAGQTTRVQVITSSDVVDRIGELLGQPAPALREPDEPPPQWTPTAAPDPREVAEQTAARKIEAWYREQRQLYRAADLLTDEAEQMLSRIAKQSYRVVTGQSIAPETLAEWVAEADVHVNAVREIRDRPPWFHPQFYDNQAAFDLLIFKRERARISTR